MLRTAELHPPLYYLLMKAWIGVAGLSEPVIRIPSACFSLVSVALTYALMRRVASEPVSLLTAFFVSVSPFEVIAGQESRMYPLFGALTLASTLALGYSLERRTIRWTAYTVLASAMMYTHYLGVFVVMAHGAWVALYERPHLRRWSAAIVGVTLLYLPWIPSVVAQITIGHGGWPDDVTVRDMTHLFGLFAFGGSLFGMPSYTFSNTSLGLAQQVMLILPFLVLLWRGVTSFASDRRRLAFLGLPLMMPIAGTLAISIAKTFFKARWFSFLFPFWAAFLAQGVLDVAERFRGQRTLIAAMLTGGLLLYSVPVLGHFYFDPNFHPFQWRERAAIVQAHVKPGDFFLYGTVADAMAFTYYFGVSHPGMVLFPHPDFPAVRRLSHPYPRMWLVVAPPFRDTMLAQTLSELQAGFTLVGRNRDSRPPVFPLVYLFEAKPPAPTSTRNP